MRYRKPRVWRRWQWKSTGLPTAMLRCCEEYSIHDAAGATFLPSRGQGDCQVIIVANLLDKLKRNLFWYYSWYYSIGIVKRNTWDIAFVPIKDAQGNVSLLGYWSWNWYVCTTGGKYLAVMTRMELPPKSARKIKGQSSETWHPSVVLGE